MFRRKEVIGCQNCDLITSFFFLFPRHSFELQESEADNNPVGLVRVVRDGVTPADVPQRHLLKRVFVDRQVKLEEDEGARENPAIDEIQSDEGQ